MHDLYEAKAKALEEYVRSLKPMRTKRALSCGEREVAGCDVVSSGRAYQVLHPKLIKSYAWTPYWKQTK